MRLWKILINAGNKVSALNTANITLIAEANPITAKKSMPTSDKPHTAITTVTPAKKQLHYLLFLLQDQCL